MEKIGLALGGGAVLGAAHIGVLHNIEDNNIRIDYIAGTSIGAFAAALFAFGKSWEEIREIALELNWMDISRITFSRYSLLSNEKLGKLITKSLGNVNIEDSKIPLSIIATDVSNGEKIILNKGPLAEAVMASTCIPGIFKPVEINDRLLVDGGVVENIPVNTVQNMGAKYIIAVDLNAKHNYQKPENIFDVILNSFHFIMKKSVSFQKKEADLIIEPDLSAFNRSDAGQVTDLINKGYEDSKEIVASIKQK